MSEAERTVGRVLLIPCDKIFPNPNQPRREFDRQELISLAVSIRVNGILQPLTVRRTVQGYELVAGERRLRASRLAGVLSVPCIVADIGQARSAVLSLIENLQRQDLSFFEQALAMQSLMDKYGLTQEELSKRLGRAPSTVSNKLRLLALPERAQRLIAANGLSERHARALLRLDDEQIIPALEKIIERSMSVTAAESYVEQLLRQDERPRRKTKRMFSDVRIFLNTVSHAVDTIREAGIDASVERCETQSEYIFHVRIPKQGR